MYIPEFTGNNVPVMAFKMKSRFSSALLRAQYGKSIAEK
jgi:hypothetical protein